MWKVGQTLNSHTVLHSSPVGYTWDLGVIFVKHLVKSKYGIIKSTLHVAFWLISPWHLFWYPGPRFTNGFFHRNSNSVEISFHSHLDSNTLIAAKFGTWHNSCAVVACAKICRDLMASNGITTMRSFHRIWVAGQKSLMKRAAGITSFNRLYW